MDNRSIKKLEADLWESADLLRAGSKLTSNQYCMPVEARDFTAKSALYLPKMAQYNWLVNLPENVVSLGLTNVSGQTMGSLGEVVNNAMELVEQQSEQLTGVLPKSYTVFSDDGVFFTPKSLEK